MTWSLLLLFPTAVYLYQDVHYVIHQVHIHCTNIRIRRQNQNNKKIMLLLRDVQINRTILQLFDPFPPLSQNSNYTLHIQKKAWMRQTIAEPKLHNHAGRGMSTIVCMSLIHVDLTGPSYHWMCDRQSLQLLVCCYGTTNYRINYK